MSLPVVPGFDVERLLGAGASCEVFLARERDGLRRPVALKVFRCAAADPAPWRTEAAYRRELDVVRKVEELRRTSRCGALVQSLATGEADGLWFLAFEWLEGGSLQARVERDGPLPVAEAVACARDVAGALALLHAAGTFHRDVKPGNLLLGAEGRVRLADFGLSRPLDGTLSAAGSPAFAAPEVIAGKATDGRRIDVYSLGATLAWLLTGETMLPGRPDVFVLERRGVPRALQRVIVDAMACDPGERLPSAEALLARLEAAPAGAPGPAEAAPERARALREGRDERSPGPAPDVEAARGAVDDASAPAREVRARIGERGEAFVARERARAERDERDERDEAGRGDDDEAPLDAAELERRRRRAWDLVERAGYAAAAATLLPIPTSEWLAVLPLHVTMVVGVGHVYGCALERQGALRLLRHIGGSVGLSYVGSQAATTVAKLLLPGVGGIAGAPFLYASTLAIGGVAIAWFERGGELGAAEIKDLFRERLGLARRSFDPSRARAGAAPPDLEDAPPAAVDAGLDLQRRLERLARLLALGLITEDEHARTARRILDEAEPPPA